MKKIIHVNQHNIRFNRKNAEQKPVLTLKTYKENVYGNQVEIRGPSRLVYRPEKLLSCGARVWIETEADVLIDGELI